jgi:hypothetical protein
MQKIKLNIYDGKKVVKTYEADEFNLMTGTCEDIINMVDIDKLTSGKLNDAEMGVEIIKVVAKSFGKFKPFLQDVFEGLTDEEYRNTSIKEVAGVVITIVKYTIDELFNVGGTAKN